MTLEHYQWAVATCRSRSFAIPQARERLVRPTGGGVCGKQGESHASLVLLWSHSCCLQACKRHTQGTALNMELVQSRSLHHTTIYG